MSECKATLRRLINGGIANEVQVLLQTLKVICEDGSGDPTQMKATVVAMLLININGSTSAEKIAGLGCMSKTITAIKSSSTHHLRNHRLASMYCCEVLCRYPDMSMSCLLDVAETQLYSLHDPIPEVRCAALHGILFLLDRIPSKLPGSGSLNIYDSILSRLLFIASDVSPYVRYLCAQALALCHPANTSVVVKGLEWESWKSANEVRKISKNKEQQSVRSRLLDSSNAKSLENESKNQDKEPLPLSSTSIIAVLLEDEHSHVRMATLRSLCFLGKKHNQLISIATPFVCDLCYDQCGSVCTDALRCLTEWANFISFSDDQLQVVYDALASSDNTILVTALRLVGFVKLPSVNSLTTLLKTLFVLLSIGSLGRHYSSIRESITRCIKLHKDWVCATLPEIIPKNASDLSLISQSSFIGMVIVIVSSHQCLQITIELMRESPTSDQLLLKLWEGISNVIERHSDLVPEAENILNSFIGVNDSIKKTFLVDFHDLLSSDTQRCNSESSLVEFLGKSVEMISLKYPTNSKFITWLKTHLCMLLESSMTRSIVDAERCSSTLSAFRSRSQLNVGIAPPRVSNLCYSKSMNALFSAQQISEWGSYNRIGLKINCVANIKWKNTLPGIELVRPQILHTAEAEVSRISAKQISCHSWEISWRVSVSTDADGLRLTSEGQPLAQVELAIFAACNELHVKESKFGVLSNKFVMISRVSTLTLSL